MMQRIEDAKLRLARGIEDLQHMRTQSFVSATRRMRSHSLPPSEMKSLYGSTTRSAVISLSYVTVAMLPPNEAVTTRADRHLV
jgi:hypothetical protein